MKPISLVVEIQADGTVVEHEPPGPAPSAEPEPSADPEPNWELWESASLANLLHLLRSYHPLEVGTPEYSRHMMTLAACELLYIHGESLKSIVRTVRTARNGKSADELRAGIVQQIRDDWAKRKAEGS